MKRKPFKNMVMCCNHVAHGASTNANWMKGGGEANTKSTNTNVRTNTNTNLKRNTNTIYQRNYAQGTPGSCTLMRGSGR